MEPATATPKRQLIDLKMGGKLDANVRGWRDQNTSWRVIAHRILQTTGVDVTPESVRDWFPEL